MSTKDDKVVEALNKIEIRLASIEVDLRHHIKRSDQHEQSIQKQNKLINTLIIGAAITAGAGLKIVFPVLTKLF